MGGGHRRDFTEDGVGEDDLDNRNLLVPLMRTQRGERSPRTQQSLLQGGSVLLKATRWWTRSRAAVPNTHPPAPCPPLCAHCTHAHTRVHTHSRAHPSQNFWTRRWPCRSRPSLCQSRIAPSPTPWPTVCPSTARLWPPPGPSCRRYRAGRRYELSQFRPACLNRTRRWKHCRSCSIPVTSFLMRQSWRLVHVDVHLLCVCRRTVVRKGQPYKGLAQFSVLPFSPLQHQQPDVDCSLTIAAMPLRHNTPQDGRSRMTQVTRWLLASLANAAVHFRVPLPSLVGETYKCAFQHPGHGHTPSTLVHLIAEQVRWCRCWPRAVSLPHSLLLLLLRHYCRLSPPWLIAIRELQVVVAGSIHRCW